MEIKGLKLKNPVILASGTAGYGEEIYDMIDLNKLGGIVTKTITLEKRKGNPSPRIAEVEAGLLNSIGLDNDGLKDFMFKKIPFFEKLKIPVIASLAGDSYEEFEKMIESLDKVSALKAFELNLSCPNVPHSSTRFKLMAQDKDAVRELIMRIKKITRKPVIAKLSPNVTDIQEIAKAAEGAGADALTCVNTFLGMACDTQTMAPKIGNVIGGVSGPCIKPLALRCVWEAHNAVKIPVIGSGGIMNASDALEFMLCGAGAIQIGTANFINPNISLEIIEGINGYMAEKGINALPELVGKLKT